MRKAWMLLALLLVPSSWLAAQVSTGVGAIRREVKPQPSVPFTLSANQPKFAHKFSVSKPGYVTLAVRWTPNDVQIVISLKGPDLPSPITSDTPFKTGQPVLMLTFTASSNALSGWELMVTYSDRSAKKDVKGEIVIAEGVAPGRKRPLTSTERMTIALQRLDKENPFIPVLVHAIERRLQGATDKSEIDRALEEALQRHPVVSREMLQKFVNDYKQVPEQIRMRITPVQLRNLSVTRKLEISTLAAVVRKLSVAERPFPVVQPFIVGKLLPLTNPVITRLEPDSHRSYRAGDTIDIIGQRFAPDRSKNRVHILIDFHGEKAPLQTLTPTVATSTGLRVTLPKLNPGQYFLRVESLTKIGDEEKETWKQSNTVDFFIETPPPPKPVITRISPSDQYPGRTVIVQGNNFVPGKETDLVWEPLDFPTPTGMALAARATVRSTTELSVNLPLLVLPGRYAMRVYITGVGISDSFIYTIKAPKYRVVFTKLKCIDETNPESFMGVDEWASDEIVTVWVVAADELLWTKQTGEYGDIDDGDERNYSASDRIVFMPNGSAGTVRAALAVATTLYEWDSGDAHAAQEFLGVVGDVANAIASAVGYGWLGQILDAVFDVIGAVIAWLGGDPDNLGRRDLGWTALELLRRTGTAKMFNGTLDFRGGDYHYRLFYEVHRVEE
jgi:hypothetical protein